MPEWVAYVDESGSGLGQKGGSGRFVLACVAGSPAAIAALAENIRRLKLELAPELDPADWELHAGEMFHARGSSPLGSMGMERQMRVMSRIVDIVCDSDVVVFSIVVTGAKMRGKRATDARVAGHAMSILAERLELLALGLGDRTTLRVVSDNAPEAHRVAMEKALARDGTPHVTGIEFVDSRSSATVQAVDALAYTINRHMGGDAMFGKAFRNIERKTLRRHQGGAGTRQDSGLAGT